MGNIELSSIGDTNFLKAQRRQLTGDAKWKDIEDLINRWAKRNPQGAWELELSLRQTREGLTDKKFATMNNEAMAGGRHMLSLHPELLQYIETFYPKFLSTKDELHEFMRRFPKFCVPEKA